MNLMKNPAALKARTTYDAAADSFDAAPLAFWDRHGRRAVALLDLEPGAHVLDVGCGTGASAIPAAVAVGPEGHVLGIDLADNMLARARAKATACGLHNAEFVVADMTSTGYSDASFDAVISVFSVFFVPDMEAQVAELWRLLRPGGALAVTVWGPGPFEPAVQIFQEEVRRVLPDLPAGPRPWERLTDHENLRRLLMDGGASDPAIEAVDHRQALAAPDDWWTIAMGSGFRWEIDQLTAEQQDAVRARTVARVADLGIEAIGAGAIHAIARKPR